MVQAGAAYSGLMLGTQQVEYRFDWTEGAQGHFDEDSVPEGHGAVPQPGQFEGF